MKLLRVGFALSDKLRPDGYAMLMSPNKGETAVHGCHCPGDMVVRMRTVLAIPRGWYVCLNADKCSFIRRSEHLTVYKL